MAEAAALTAAAHKLHEHNKKIAQRNFEQAMHGGPVARSRPQQPVHPQPPASGQTPPWGPQPRMWGQPGDDGSPK